LILAHRRSTIHFYLLIFFSIKCL